MRQRRWRFGMAAGALALAVAACQGGPPTGPADAEGAQSAARAGRAKVAVGNTEIALRTADGKPLTGLAVQIGGKAYPVKDGKLALPADALARAKADGGVVILAPGYVPRLVALDAKTEVALAPLAPTGEAQPLGPGGGEASSPDGAVSAAVAPGRLAGQASVAVSLYTPGGDREALASAEWERLRRALQQAGATPPATCGDPLPCPPLVGALGVLVAVDGPLAAGPLPVSIDVAALAAATGEAEQAYAKAAARLMASLAAIDARPDAEAWHRAMGTAFGLSWAGPVLTLAVPIGAEARTTGTTRVDVAGVALLGAAVEVTVVSAVEGGLPAEARPPGMPPAPAAPGPTATAPGPTPPAPGPRTLLGSPRMGADGGKLLTTGGPFTGGAAATLIGLDGGSLIGQDGGSLIGQDGGSLIGQDGGSLIGQDGGSLVANNVGGAITGHVRVPFMPDAAKYHLSAFTDYAWPNAVVWPMDGHGRPYAAGVTADETGAYRIDKLGSSMSGLFLGVEAGRSRLFALAKAPGNGTRDVLVDAATTAASCVYLTEVLGASGAMRPVDQDRYLALAAALRAKMGQADAQAAVSQPIAAVATLTRKFCAANGIAVDLTGTVSTFAGVPSGLGGTFVPGRADGVRFNGPADVVWDPAGNRLVVAEVAAGGVRAIDFGTMQATTVGGPLSRVRGLARLADGRVFGASVANNGIFAITSGPATLVAGSTHGYADGPALSAKFRWPTGMAADPAGNLVVADPMNHCIRRYEVAAGRVTTIAGVPGGRGWADGSVGSARFAGPDAIAVAPSGAIYVADRDNHCIRMIQGGVVRTIAGAPGQSGGGDGFRADARFNFPRGLALDTAGNLFVSDSGNGRIRRLTPAGLVSTVAGGRPRLPTELIAHADGPAASTLFSDNHGIGFGPGGDLFVADLSNHCVRRIQF